MQRSPTPPLVIFLAFATSAACGARLTRLPLGPGVPAPDIERVVGEATGACRAVSSITAEVNVTGSVGSRRLRARLLVGLATPALARVEAFAFGQRVFILVAQGAEATLLLTRENRVLANARPDDILETIAGVPLDASNLRAALLGCHFEPARSSPDAAREPAEIGAAAGRQIGDDWRVTRDGQSELYFRRRSQDARWRLVAAVHRGPGGPEWRAEYRDFVNDLPGTVLLVSRDPARFDLRLVLSQVELNATLPPTAFEIQIPSTADPITIEELREKGPPVDGH